MISNTYANNILSALAGKSAFPAPANVYLGLSATQPALSNGAVGGEPASVNSYARVLVGGTSTAGKAANGFGSAADGEISTSKEIKFNTAKEDYPDKLNYWFLSENETKGSAAYMWGRIKDVLREKKDFAGFAVAADLSGYYSASETSEELLGLKEGETYIVYWGDTNKEYEGAATLYSKDGTSYIALGNPVFYGGEDDGTTPFGLLYTESTTGTETTGTVKIYSKTGEGSHKVAIYGLGIQVKNKTVPTFYAGELTVKIDTKTEE